MPPRRTARNQTPNKGLAQQQVQQQVQQQAQQQAQEQAQNQTQNQAQNQAQPQEETPGQPKKLNTYQLMKQRKHVAKLKAADRGPLSDAEIRAFTKAIEDGNALLQHVAAQDPQQRAYKWRYYDGERDEDQDATGTPVDREYDSDGTEEVPPRLRQEFRGKIRSYGPVSLLPKEIQEAHLSAVEEAHPGEVDRRGIELEQDYPTIVKTQPVLDVEDNRIAPCDRCKVKSIICDKTGWACRACVVRDVDCTFTHRTTHHTIHLARQPDDPHRTDPKFQGWERKQIRFATKSMVLFHDMLQTTAERARIAENALAASNRQEVMQVIQQTSVTTRGLRSDLRRAQLDCARKDAEIANLRLQLQTLQDKDTASTNELGALRTENQRLNGEIFRIQQGNPASTASTAPPPGGKKVRIRDRRGERERLRQRRAEREAAAAAAEAAEAAAAQPAAPAPAPVIDLTGGTTQPANPFSYDPQPSAGPVGTPELMSEDNLNLLQQATYDFSQAPQPTAPPQETQQQPNDPYGGLDPELFVNNSSSANPGYQFGELDEQDFVPDDASPEEIARLIEEQDAANAQAAGQGRNASESQFFTEAYGGAAASPQAESSAQAARRAQAQAGARESTFDAFAVPTDMPDWANEPTDAAAANAPSGYTAAGDQNWPTGEMDETDQQMASMMQGYNRDSPGFDAAVAEAQRNRDGDGDEMMMD